MHKKNIKLGILFLYMHHVKTLAPPSGGVRQDNGVDTEETAYPKMKIQSSYTC